MSAPDDESPSRRNFLAAGAAFSAATLPAASAQAQQAHGAIEGSEHWASNRRPIDRDMIRSIFTRDHPGTSDLTVVQTFAPVYTGA